MNYNEFKSRYKEIRRQQKKMYNYKFWFCFIAIIILVVVICIKQGLDPKISAFIGAATGSLLTLVWKNISNEKE